MSGRYVPAILDAALGDGLARSLELGGWPVALCRVDGRVHAVIDRCPHAGSRLSWGRLRRASIFCPLHGAGFDLTTGKCQAGPYEALQVFPVRTRDGWIEVEVPDTSPDDPFRALLPDP